MMPERAREQAKMLDGLKADLQEIWEKMLEARDLLNEGMDLKTKLDMKITKLQSDGYRKAQDASKQ